MSKSTSPILPSPDFAPMSTISSAYSVQIVPATEMTAERINPSELGNIDPELDPSTPILFGSFARAAHAYGTMARSLSRVRRPGIQALTWMSTSYLYTNSFIGISFIALPWLFYNMGIYYAVPSLVLTSLLMAWVQRRLLILCEKLETSFDADGLGFESASWSSAAKMIGRTDTTLDILDVLHMFHGLILASTCLSLFLQMFLPLLQLIFNSDCTTHPILCNRFFTLSIVLIPLIFLLLAKTMYSFRVTAPLALGSAVLVLAGLVDYFSRRKLDKTHPPLDSIPRWWNAPNYWYILKSILALSAVFWGPFSMFDLYAHLRRRSITRMMGVQSMTSFFLVGFYIAIGLVGCMVYPFSWSSTGWMGLLGISGVAIFSYPLYLHSARSACLNLIHRHQVHTRLGFNITPFSSRNASPVRGTRSDTMALLHPIVTFLFMVATYGLGLGVPIHVLSWGVGVISCLQWPLVIVMN